MISPAAEPEIIMTFAPYGSTYLRLTTLLGIKT
jgi:hypothetical protein